MRKRVVLAALAILAFACGLARGDGMVLLPSQLLKGFTEQTQLAVVEVRPDRTVAVDLFISLSETSGRSHEVPFLLPLQTMPDEFRVREVDLAEFERSHIEPLTRALDRAEEARRDATPLMVFGGCSLLCSPCSVVGLAVLLPVFAKAKESAGGVATPSPAMSVETEHVRADVYPALKSEEVAALAQLPELPQTLREALTGYTGRPFALVRLRTLPTPARDVRGYWDLKHEGIPGVHFRFTQGMLQEDGRDYYDYPLGTGRGWEHDIPVTQVYVTAPDDLRLDVDFPEGPGMPRRRGSWFKLAEGVDGRQIHAVTYRQARPDRDVRIALRGRGLTPFRLAQWGRFGRAAGTWVGFPALAFLAWLAVFRTVVWKGPFAKGMGLWGGLLKSWLAAQGALLWALSGVAALFAFGCAASASGPNLALALFVAFSLVMVVVFGYFLGRGYSADTRDFMWQSAGASVVAAIGYAVAGLVLLGVMGALW